MKISHRNIDGIKNYLPFEHWTSFWCYWSQKWNSENCRGKWRRWGHVQKSWISCFESNSNHPKKYVIFSLNFVFLIEYPIQLIYFNKHSENTTQIKQCLYFRFWLKRISWTLLNLFIQKETTSSVPFYFTSLVSKVLWPSLRIFFWKQSFMAKTYTMNVIRKYPSELWVLPRDLSL